MSVKGGNKAILARGLAGFNETRNGWFDVHDDLVVAYGLAPDPVNFDRMKKYYEEFWEAFPDVKVEADSMVEEGDVVALRATLRGTHLGMFNGVAPTGRRFVQTFQAQYRFSDGKIVERWANPDTFGLLLQLGVISDPFPKQSERG